MRLQKKISQLSAKCYTFGQESAVNTVSRFVNTVSCGRREQLEAVNAEVVRAQSLIYSFIYRKNTRCYVPEDGLISFFLKSTKILQLYKTESKYKNYC